MPKVGNKVKVGDKFGSIEVIEDLGTRVTTDRNRQYVKVECTCGNIYDVFAMHLHRFGPDRRCPKCAARKKSPYQIGDKYDKLTIIRFEKTENVSRGRAQAICLCDCGNEVLIRPELLRINETSSCGVCTPRGSFKGSGELGQTFFYKCQTNARVRNLLFEVTKDELWALFLKQNRRCALTGVELKFNYPKSTDEATASLDRIDSSKGYTMDNVQWVHKRINVMKMDSTDEEFVEWCRKTVQYQSEKQNA